MSGTLHTTNRLMSGAGLLVAVACLLAGAHPVWAEAISKEYQVKAACLFNFVQFVEWPDSTFADASTPITIGVLGDDPFGAALDKLVAGESVHKRKLVIKRSRNVEDLKSCHLIFVSKSETSQISQILTAIEQASILTVGESAGFAQSGGVINFFVDQNKVRFEINPESAQRKGLKISPQLLKLGKIVGPGQG